MAKLRLALPSLCQDPGSARRRDGCLDRPLRDQRDGTEDAGMRFSLVVATLGRVEELKELFLSLEAQAHSDFEVIVIDQNADDRLAWIEDCGQYTFPITRKRSNLQQLSHARNIGLLMADGDIVAFPDDDCVYPAGLLAKVNSEFCDDRDVGVRTGPAVDPGGNFSSGRWQKESGEITADNAWYCAIAFNIFIRRNLVMTIGGFDEQLGVGATFGSAEETDLVLRVLQAGSRGWYDVTQVVLHPDKSLSPIAVKRAFAYGAGFGYVLRKHGVPIRIWLTFMLRSVGGCLVNLAHGRLMSADYYWRTLRGRVYGFCAYRDIV